MGSCQIQPIPGQTEWFRHDRFGMFICFGPYSMPARHEWIKTMEKIPEDKYDKYFNHDMFDARIGKKGQGGGHEIRDFDDKAP